MEPPRVYVETTVPSAYFDTRTAPEMIRRREATRRWWATAAERYELVTSITVREELAKGPTEKAFASLRLIDDLQLLELNSEVFAAYSTYLRHKLMPAGDAMHLALAAWYQCGILLTWDFKHLANPNKFGHIQRVNESIGLSAPRIVAPPALLGGRT